MLPNIFLVDSSESRPYERPSGGDGEAKRPERDRKAHAEKLIRQIDTIIAEDDEGAEERGGTYLRFNSSPRFPLDPEAFENRTRKIILLRLNTDEDTGRTSATVFVPYGKENFFRQKVTDYADVTQETKKGHPRNQEFVEDVDGIDRPPAKSFWSGKAEEYPDKFATWCEVWINTSQMPVEDALGKFDAYCDERNIEHFSDHLIFPECVVVMAKLDGKYIEEILHGIGAISEIRRAAEPTSSFVNADARFQKELVDDLTRRLVVDIADTSVCLLDTGLNASHPLLGPAIQDGTVLAARSGWPSSDERGHGTGMAGIALFNDLKSAVLDQGPVALNHSIESVRIFPPSGANEHNMYGVITKDAISEIEIAKPASNRVFCMAVTDDSSITDGSPTSWSAQLDTLASAAGENEDDKRLLLVSAGNINTSEFRDVPYPSANLISPVESPAQAWNVLTVGAYSDDVIITEKGFNGFAGMAEKGGLCPYSRTSRIWNNVWPVKPEICCDGGNLATNGFNWIDSDDLSKLTIANNLSTNYFTSIRATSSATAQASWMAARIMDAHPGIWPETVRALLVHSSRWTDTMKRQFLPEHDTSKGQRRDLLRACGWGVPNIDYALGSLDNRVNLIIQGEIQPFKNDGTCNEMRIHELPWPKEELLRLGEKEVELRVTLSYFIEPNPGERGWASKFQYQSCGLRFQVIGKSQSREEFLGFVSKKMRDSETDYARGSASSEWYLGQDNRDVGSIHSDFKKASAADLCDARYVAVYPVGGWWKMLKSLGKRTEKLRYSLVVSIDSEEVEADLYNEVITKIKIPIETSIPVLHNQALH